MAANRATNLRVPHDMIPNDFDSGNDLISDNTTESDTIQCNAFRFHLHI